MKKLTQKRLKELLYYDPDTGIFKWRVSRKGNKGINSIAGSLHNEGYLVIGLDKKIYKNHRLAWLYVYGYFPEHDIDHINRIKTDNRICNLREVSRSCNTKNKGNSKNNNSGVKGLSWSKECNKWTVQIGVYGNPKKYLGRYKNFDEAVCVRLAAEQCLDWNGCDSNSPAFQYVQEMLKRPKKRKLPKIIV